MKSNWYKFYNYGKTKNLKKKAERRSANDHGEFQQQSPQRLDDGYKYTSSLYDRWMMRLKTTEAEYYSIKD